MAYLKKNIWGIHVCLEMYVNIYMFILCVSLCASVCREEFWNGRVI